MVRVLRATWNGAVGTDGSVDGAPWRTATAANVGKKGAAAAGGGAAAAAFPFVFYRPASESTAATPGYKRVILSLTL